MDDSGFIDTNPFVEVEMEHRQLQANTELFEIRNEDYAWRVDARPKYGALIMWILICQHFFAFTFICHAYENGNLCDYQWLFGSFFGMILAETFLIVNFVIRWLFVEIPYNNYSKK